MGNMAKNVLGKIICTPQKLHKFFITSQLLTT